jgi:hypothetical protein
MQNIKPNISYNGSKNISNNVMGCCALPTMGMSKKGYVHRVYKLAINVMG